MAVFVEITTDAFEDNLHKQARRKRGKDNRSGRAGRRIARRPMRGIEIKDDTYAMIKVIDAAGQAIPLVDSSSPDGNTKNGYANFLLQSVNETRIEKQQIVETFGDAYIFFFGESPRFVDIQAVLLNSHDFNWRAEWWQNYNDLLRGTRLVENGARVYLFYDDIILEGYLLQAGVAETTQEPYRTALQFKMFVTNYSNISLVGNPNFPIRSSVVLPHDVNLTEGDASLRLISRYRDGGWDANSIDAFDNQAGGIQNANQGGTNEDGSASFSEQFGPFEASGGVSAGAGQAQAGVAFGTSGSQPKSSANPLARKVSDAFRNVPRSFAVSQDVWTFLFSATEAVEDIAKLVVRAGKPIRGLIAENFDEYVGLPESKTRSFFGLSEKGEAQLTKSGTVRSQQEVDDLWREAIQFLSCYGANINNPDSLLSLGLGPNGLEAGLGGNKVSFNPFTDEGQKKAGDFFENQGEQIGSGFEQFANNPLGAVFGHPQGSTNNNQLGNKPKYTEGAGDPLYGYPSDFAEGQPGFGVAGFGDFGGTGFGSGQGEHGDPGFKDPNKFTFAGVAEELGAFERFVEPKEDSTAISAGAGVSIGLDGVSAGAGVSVGGKPSAFAVVSVPGILDSSGNAREKADAIAEKQALQKFGFATDNPFGVTCPKPDGQSSVHKEFTLP